MRAALRRGRAWAERRLPALVRPRRPEPLPIELHRRRIYIVPTRFGLGFAVLLLVMLGGALNYANNAALLLTCLLGAAAAASMLAAFRTLDGLCLDSIRAGHAVAGRPLELRLDFASQRPRCAVRIDTDTGATAFAMPGGDTTVTLSLPTGTRGWLPLPRLRVWTSWPLGLFRAWSWLHPGQAVLVWPEAESAGPPPPGSDDAGPPRLHQGEDVAALRAYRHGDPIRHAAWKASARHQGLLVKDFERPDSRLDWHLDWYRVSLPEHEARIARLARWLGQAQAQGRRYSLRLPGEHIDAGSGHAHYVRCMNALARLP